MKLVAACLLLLAPAAGATTWVVDAAGGGNFTSIQAAIDAASPGDVLLVKPGFYTAFTLGKDLSILGTATGPAPTVIGQSLLLMENAEIAGLRFGTLELLGASGVVLLDEIEVTGSGVGLAACDGMRVEGCAQVHIARSLLHGMDGTPTCESIGVGIVDSVVTLTGCTVTGGEGWGDGFLGYDGQEGLEISGDSAVLLAQSSVYGGNGGVPDVIFDGVGGDGAVAIRMNSGGESAPATCTVRGTSAMILQGGFGGFAGLQPGMDAFAAVAGSGTLTLSGVSYDPENFGAQLDVVMPSPAQPFMHLVGEDVPGAFKRLNMYGPSGTPLLLFASLNSAQLSLPGPVDGTIWLDLGTPVLILPFTLQGPELAQNLTFKLPASLAGLQGISVVFQGFAAGMGASGNHLATNPAHLLIR